MRAYEAKTNRRQTPRIPDNMIEARKRLLIGYVLLAAFVLGSTQAIFGHNHNTQPQTAKNDDAGGGRGGVDDDGKQCFCELKGSINDCSCTVDTVDYFNNNKIYPRMRSLLQKDYFRFYRVHLHKPCPFWQDDSKCAMRHCSVSACAATDIPHGLRADGIDEEDEELPVEAPYAKYTTPVEQHEDNGCHDNGHAAADRQPHQHDEAMLGYLNTSISRRAAKGFERWAANDELEENFCILDDREEAAEYVDLRLNPERYTGYRGESAHRLWRTIYEENCFGPDAAAADRLAQRRPFVMQSGYADMCMEQRAFYRLLSGMHTSINVHLCADYLQTDAASAATAAFGRQPDGVWARNLEEFKRRFSAATTRGEGLHWLQNLYFVYLVEMRALAKAAAYLRQEQYYTGAAGDEDAEVRTAVNDLLNVIETFPTHFDESAMFSGGDSYESLHLKTAFREKFRNISRIMDCVGCDKCRLWGKLQVQGLGTALKILFSEKFKVRVDRADIDPHFRLRRTEIVSLFNAFGRLSNSINELEEFRKVIR